MIEDDFQLKKKFASIIDKQDPKVNKINAEENNKKKNDEIYISNKEIKSLDKEFKESNNKSLIIS